MKFKEFDISKESVLQSLIDAGLEIEENGSVDGAFLEIEGKLVPLPRTFSLFEDISFLDESTSVVRYVTEISDKCFESDVPTYSTTLITPYLSASKGKYVLPDVA